jgi:hypothetical protein
MSASPPKPPPSGEIVENNAHAFLRKLQPAVRAGIGDAGVQGDREHRLFVPLVALAEVSGYLD